MIEVLKRVYKTVLRADMDSERQMATLRDLENAMQQLAAQGQREVA